MFRRRGGIIFNRTGKASLSLLPLGREESYFDCSRDGARALCILLYSNLAQLIEDQPHLLVIELHGLDRRIRFNWLRIYQGIENFRLPVRRDRPIAVERGH